MCHSDNSRQWMHGFLTNKRVVVHEIIQRSCAECKSSDNLSRLNHFASIRDNTELNKVDYTITEHLRVNAKVAMVRQLTKHRVWNWTNACRHHKTTRELHQSPQQDYAKNIPLYQSNIINCLSIQGWSPTKIPSLFFTTQYCTSAINAMAVCLSVRVLSIGPKDIIKQALPHNSLRNLVFWRQDLGLTPMWSPPWGVPNTRQIG